MVWLDTFSPLAPLLGNVFYYDIVQLGHSSAQVSLTGQICHFLLLCTGVQLGFVHTGNSQAQLFLCPASLVCTSGLLVLVVQLGLRPHLS